MAKVMTKSDSARQANCEGEKKATVEEESSFSRLPRRLSPLSSLFSLFFLVTIPRAYAPLFSILSLLHFGSTSVIYSLVQLHI